MRLNDFMNEADKIEMERKQAREWFEEIESFCGPFIKELSKVPRGSSYNFLYSGRYTSKPFIKKKVRQDRKPKDTPIDIHNFFDHYFNSKFHKRLRSNTIFVASEYDVASDYGDFVYIIFPKGKFELYWNERIKDLFGDIVDVPSDVDIHLVMSGEPPDWLIDTFEQEWENSFGEGEDGKWKYKGKTYKGDKYDVVEEILPTLLKGDIDDYDEDAIEEIKYNIEDALEWEPSISFNDYAEDRAREEIEIHSNEFERLMDGYKKGTVKDACYTDVEIMLYCKEYYGISINALYRARGYMLEWNEFRERNGIKVDLGEL